jgi:hypothetical protein
MLKHKKMQLVQIITAGSLYVYDEYMRYTVNSKYYYSLVNIPCAGIR